MRIVRHWKDVFDPTSDFVFIKRMKLGLPGHEVVQAGDAVTGAMKHALGRERLKIWWTARVIGTREYAIGIGINPSAPDLKIRPTGRGWFEVAMADGTVRKVRGRESAEQLLHT